MLKDFLYLKEKNLKVIKYINNATKLRNLYDTHQIFVLPSYTEGFPKVIAEAASYGCVPIVTNIGSIGQYINKENGILLKDLKTNLIISSIDLIA